MIGIKDQYFGTEIEMTGITRQRAAEVVAEMFGTEAYYDGTTYGVWSVIDLEGKKWKFMSDGSIYTQRKVYGRIVDAGGEYSTEMVSPKLSYDEMGKLQEVVRCLRQHGGFVNESCGQHVHVDAANHTPQSLKNALTIMYAKEDILFKALKVQERREYSYCQKVRPDVLEKIRKIPNRSITMDRVRNVWYGGRDGSHIHYDDTRYYALNLHAVFSKGTLEWRCFESTLHAGKVRANITLALAISAQAINQRSTQMKKTLETVYMEILKKLYLFPERLRCMFLHLWCLGLRASEVCTLKGNAYYQQGEDYWIQVYQVKMKNYKRIPIPQALYQIMKVYLKKHEIQPEEFIFKNSRGGACLYGTFRTQMIEACRENKIANGEYLFQSHDYRHTVATMFYDSHVSLQSIRDYLGHTYEEMTRQYIDYMPQRIAKANDEFFEMQGSSLASWLKKEEKDGK